jgi:iron complex outermembrane recepter protein
MPAPSRLVLSVVLGAACAIGLSTALALPSAAQEAPKPPELRPETTPPWPPTAPEGAAEAEPVPQLPPVVIIGTTPLPALGVPIDKYAGNVQSIPARDIENQNLLDMSDNLYRRLGSVNILGTQGNPFQNDLTYRGFLASPLTGSPIGVSMYVDGMRFNDGFGDTINWDLLPDPSIASIDIIPGSNPIFGLNTIGGALAVHTKRGFDFPGTEFEAYGGSFGRWAMEATHGGFRGPFDWFITFNAFNESGWRDESPSEVYQLFTQVGLRTDRTDLSLNFAYANNNLTGNALAPESLLARDRRAVYTFPDLTHNLMYLGNLRGSQWLTDDLLLSGNAFYRYYKRNTLNGDAEVSCVDNETDGVVFGPDGRVLPLGLCQGPAAGFFDADGNPLTGELEREAEAEDRTTETITQDWGATLQLSYKGTVFGRGNRATLGVAYDGHYSAFRQREAEAEFVPHGNSTGVERTGPFETEIGVRTQQQNVGIYFLDIFDITDQLALTAGARYQYSSIKIRDHTGDNAPLDGDHSFSRISPIAGLTYKPLSNLGLFFSYSEGFRAPTAAELTCADPDAPCNLPNAFIADPPLDPVIGRTYELGARGRLPLGDGLTWNVALFRTDVQDDILFTVVETGGAGFFQNVERTRRQGVEVGLQGSWKRLRYFLSYAFVDATYQTDVTLASVTEPAGVVVKAGNRIPGIPQNNLKVGAEVAILDNLWAGADLIAVSGNYLRGDDGNRLSPVKGYAVLNLQVRYAPIKFLEIRGRVDNVTNNSYETAGALNWNAFADPISVQRFLAPGAPIGGWAGVKVRF